MFILLSLAMPIFLNSKLVKFKNDEFKRNVLSFKSYTTLLFIKIINRFEISGLMSKNLLKCIINNKLKYLHD